MIRDLDDMKDFKTWLDTRHERAKKKEDEKVARLKRALIEPKHMMDSRLDIDLFTWRIKVF